MKDIFHGFYSPSDEDIKKVWNEESTLFIFDTNVLLYLYGYAKNTKNDFFKILEKISHNIWLPYHVGLEYQRNRLKVIKDEKYNFSKIENYMNDIDKIFTKNIKELNLEQRHPELNNKTNNLYKKIISDIDKYKKSLEALNKKQPCVMSSDEIRKQINILFENKVGDKPIGQEWLESLYTDGKKRYENKVPPGYEDKKEKEKKPIFSYSGLDYVPMYGDLIIWKQIIEKAKNDDIKSVIFVSDDVKEDWVFSIDVKGKKKIGVRAELRDEIQEKSKINLFTILTTSDFMEKGKVNLDINVSDESINETKNNIENKRHTYTMRLDAELLNKHKELAEFNSLSLNDMLKNSVNDYVYKHNQFSTDLLSKTMLENSKISTNNLLNKLEEFETKDNISNLIEKYKILLKILGDKENDDESNED